MKNIIYFCKYGVLLDYKFLKVRGQVYLTCHSSIVPSTWYVLNEYVLKK